MKSPSLGIAVLQLVAWLVFLLLLLRFDTLRKRCAEGVAVLFALTLVVDTYRLITGPSRVPGETAKESHFSTLSVESTRNPAFERLKVFSNERNVLHILLDEMQSSLLEKILAQDPGLVAELDGFYWFTDTSGIHGFTELSLPGMLSGQVFSNDRDKTPYLRQAFNENALFDGLQSAGYQLDFQIYHLYCRPEYLASCSTAPQLSILPQVWSLLDFSLLRIAPAAIRWKSSLSETGLLAKMWGRNKLHASQPGLGVLIFEELSQEISVQSIPPTYKFFHSLITHAPLVLDSDCSIRPESEHTDYAAIALQYRCGLKQVVGLLQELKRLGIYDRTLIILSSDHGGHFRDPKNNNALRDASINPSHFARAQATLMIKPMASLGPLQRSQYPARLSDIAQTIAGQLNMPGDYGGANVFEANWNPRRPRDYHYALWTEVQRHERMPEFWSYRISGDVSDPAAWEILQSPD